MKKYFYTNGVDKFGPFSFEKLKDQSLTRETKIWYYGLEKWTPLSQIEELDSIAISIPPSLGKVRKEDDSNIKHITNKIPDETWSKKKNNPKNAIIIITVLLAFSLTGYFIYKNQQKLRLYNNITSSAYESNEDFNFYLDKFYRDIEVYGIFPKKPKTQIIKFAKFDQIENATHIHGLSFGVNNDDIIEIYLNPSTWQKFNKPMRYYLMYHELAHDILNFDDLSYSPENEGKLMYPAIESYESKTMDDFIESAHELFEKISAKQKND